MKHDPRARRINSHLWGGSHYCYIDLPDGRRIRISRARTRKGNLEGRIIAGSMKTWEQIPPGADIQLS